MLSSTTPSSSSPSSSAYKKARRQYLRATKTRDSHLELDWTPFRAAEKRYKARFPPPDLSNVLDLATLHANRAEEVSIGGWHGCADAVETKEIVNSGSKAYIIPRIPGLVIIPSFVSQEEQKNLVRWCLSGQARYPNETNLDAHYILPKDGLWNTCLSSRNDPSLDILIKPKASESPESITQELVGGRRQLIDNTPANPENFPSISSAPKPPPFPSPTVPPSLATALLAKLRWANIGFSYHWGSKQYDFSKEKQPVNSQIRNVCKRAVAAVDWNQVYGGSDSEWGDEGPVWKTWNETYEPDAGIVNFYQTKDTLMAHVDRSEICATSPLVSISLGNAAIFLIGGTTRDLDPVPILVRSGDVVIMSGPACRRAYHGIPRVLENTLPPHLSDGSDEWKPYEEYMRTTRINVNVRQVFPIGFVAPVTD